MLSYDIYIEYKNLLTLISSNVVLLNSYNSSDRKDCKTYKNINNYICSVVLNCLSLPSEDWMDELERNIPDLDILFEYTACISQLYDVQALSELPPDIYEKLYCFQLEDSVLKGITTVEDTTVVLHFSDVLYYSPGGCKPPSGTSLQITLTDAQVVSTPAVPSFTGFFGAEKLTDDRYVLAVYGDGGQLIIEFNDMIVQQMTL